MVQKRLLKVWLLTEIANYSSQIQTLWRLIKISSHDNKEAVWVNYVYFEKSFLAIHPYRNEGLPWITT